MSELAKVVFQPEGRTVYVLPGSILAEAAGKAGITINTPCGGKGTCGKCRVHVTQGAPEPTAECLRHLSDLEIENGIRLACQVHVRNDIVINIPKQSRFFNQKMLMSGAGRDVPLEPDVRKYHLKLPEPTLNDQRADSRRLLDGIAQPDVVIPLAALRDLPGVLRQARYDVTVVVVGDRVMEVEPGDTSRANYGMAFDIGTTTVVGMLLNLHDGEETAVGARTNPQIAHGDDVVSRIGFAGRGRKDRNTLQAAIVNCLNEIIAESCAQAGIDSTQIYEITVAGNTTMNHLLLGIDPSYLAQAPYVAALQDALDTPASELGIHIHPRGNVHTLPNIAGFVGGDTVGVILATNLLAAERMALAIDIGTNGELVAGNKDRLISCSTAAGPALEGARIRFGMRAAEGAIDKVILDGDVQLSTIGNARPRGICGTAIIDIVAELLRVGVLDSTGRMLSPDECPRGLPDPLRSRLMEGDRGFSFVLVRDGDADSQGPIFVTQRDVREVQLAKAAIAAGTNILLKELGIGVEDLHQVLLAGAFGNFIRRSTAKRIGLLPAVPNERIQFVGNAAGAGARMALYSRQSRAQAAKIAEFTRYVELAGRPDFQAEFTSAMLFEG